MKVFMYNPKTKVTISTVEEFKPQWEKLGFVELVGSPNNVLLLSMAG